jgi:hypothetical protein
MAAEKTPTDPYLAAVDLLRLERALSGLELRIEAVRDRQIAFPSELTQIQLEKLVDEHASVSAVIDELRAVTPV